MRKKWLIICCSLIAVLAVAVYMLIGHVGQSPALPTPTAQAVEIINGEGTVEPPRISDNTVVEEEMDIVQEGLLSIEAGVNVELLVGDEQYRPKNRANIKVEPRTSQGSLPIVSVNTDDGIKIETTLGEPYIKSAEDIKLYTKSHSVEQTELWLADDIEQYFGGWNDVEITIHTLEPLKITPVISKRSVNKYEEETVG